MRLSLRGRLTLWYTIALLVALTLIGIEIVFVIGRLGVRQTDSDLTTLSETVAKVIDAELQENPDVGSAAREALAVASGPDRAIGIVNGDGTLVAARSSRPDVISAIQAGEAGTVKTGHGEWRVQVSSRTFHAGTRPIVLRIAVGESLHGVHREQGEVREAMMVGIPLALLLAAAGGWWITSIGLRPISEMARQAAVLSPAGSGELGNPDRGDEVGVLARAFNDLLARLRAALRTQQQFMADASHELRTPTSVIRTAADVSLGREQRDEADYRETLAIIRTEAQRLGRLVSDMLVLARADAGGQPLHPVDLYLDELVDEGRRAVAVLAAERQVTLCDEPGGEVPFRGDEDLLRQLVVNVLQNAVQHTPAGGVVRIKTACDAGSVVIRIADQGPGIAEADRERIFDRFVRLDASRGGVGTGLGLPIARWIAAAHHGTLTLESSSAEGSVFAIVLPLTQ
ncbi:MAG TPA: ATP-binding protein [Vicinamibacterales bacterium]|jgi:heavy metal sensor kinase